MAAPGPTESKHKNGIAAPAPGRRDLALDMCGPLSSHTVTNINSRNNFLTDRGVKIMDGGDYCTTFETHNKFTFARSECSELARRRLRRGNGGEARLGRCSHPLRQGLLMVWVRARIRVKIRVRSRVRVSVSVIVRDRARVKLGQG